jgi:hypothetical protein
MCRVHALDGLSGCPSKLPSRALLARSAANGGEHLHLVDEAGPIDIRLDRTAEDNGCHAADVNHGQRGDPRKLETAFITLVNAKNPPLRLPLGSDTVERIEAKNSRVAEELAAWRKLSTSTDHDQTA